MSESLIHMKLVKEMAIWVKYNLLNGSGESILIDYQLDKNYYRPPIIEGHIPDLFADDKSANLLIIGEAKTAHDIEMERTERQIKSFLCYCSLHINSILIIAVPWHMTRFAKSLIKMICDKMKIYSVKCIVLEHLPG